MALTTVRLPVVLQGNDAQHAASCRQCLKDRLAQRQGIEQVELDTDQDPTHVELTYDADLLSLAQVQRTLQNAQACLSPDVVIAVVPVSGLVSSNSERRLEKALAELPGVSASASYASGTLRLEFDRRLCPLPQIVDRVDQLGYRADFSRGRVVAHRTRPSLSITPSAGQSRDQAEAAAGQLPDQRQWWQKAWDRGARGMSWLVGQHEFFAAGLGGVLLIIAAALWLSGAHPGWRLAFALASAVASGWYTFPEAIQSLKQWQLDVDVLMFVAAAGAAVLGHFEEGALLLWLFALGNAGEHLALDRARRAVAALSDLTPQTAIRIEDDGSQRTVDVAELAVDDHVLVRPFDRIPADGQVIEGESSVDESAITGESEPVDKQVGHELLAGTMNHAGRLTMTVTRPADQTTLARIIALVREAQTTKSPTQLFTQKIERRYVPAVLLATVALILIPPLTLGGEGAWGTWFYRAMAFLTAASPCALAIGTPATILCGIAQAARMGVLIKGGVYLEMLGRIEAIALDKTGTLTLGKPELVQLVQAQKLISPPRGVSNHDEVIDPGGVSDQDGTRGDQTALGESQLLSLAAAVEQQSSHPIAQAIVDAARHRRLDVPEAANLEQASGQGIVATVQGRRVRLVKASAWVLDQGDVDLGDHGDLGDRSDSDGHDAPASSASSASSASNASSGPDRTAGHVDRVLVQTFGRDWLDAAQACSLVVMELDGQAAALLLLKDQVRPEAGDAIAALQSAGVRHIAMLTGDRPEAAQAVANQLNVTTVHAGLMPDQKLDRLTAMERERGSIAMVGDGVNDAPAIAHANVGIAMGAAGTDVAMETADVVLMSNDLMRLPAAVGLSRFARRVVLQNLVFALAVIAIVAPAAALGYAALGVAVLLHEGSTVMVVLNALRLLRYRDPPRTMVRERSGD